jgi:hypothetical protein
VLLAVGERLEPLEGVLELVVGQAVAHLVELRTYEIMTPESVGVHKTSLVMGKHSGRAAFRSKLDEMVLVDQGLDVLVVDVLLAVGERLEPLEGVLELVVGTRTGC